MPILTRRPGARRRADIPAEVLERLHRGEESTITLVEWLAIDQRRLVAARAAAWDALAVPLAEAAAASHGTGIMDRVRAVGRALADTTAARGPAFAALAGDPADTVRCWAAFAVGFAPADTLAERLALLRPFAADSHMGVRECAWMALRPHLAADLTTAWRLLPAWATDGDANVRRCAIEATRPRGVWCAHIQTLKDDPDPGLPLLELVRADPSRYVQNSCANWLNDAAKTCPRWVGQVVSRWLRESPGKATAYIGKRALRSLR